MYVYSSFFHNYAHYRNEYINTFTTEYFDIYIYIYYVCVVNCMLMLLWWTSSTVTVDWPLVTFVTSASPPHALAGSTLDNSHLYSISYLYLCGICEFSMYFIWREWVWNVTLLSIYIYIYTRRVRHVGRL